MSQERPAVPIAPPSPAPAAAQAGQPRGLPLLRLGFRPFYLGAAAFACLSVPLWLAVFFGHLTLDAQIAPLLWHAHEMLFGFAAAVIIGFLLTAGKAWTGLATPRGAFLGALAGLWLAARIAALAAPYAVYAVLDVLLLPVVAAVLLDVLLRSGNKRNLPLAGILALLALANLCFHLAVLGIIGVQPMHALFAALGLIVMIECVMAGRVLPFFTMSATPGLKLDEKPWVVKATLATSALALALWVFAPAGWIVALAFVLAAACHLLRQWSWQPWVTRGRPILWILHAAYLWLPIGFVLLAAAQPGWVAESIGVHALAVGATGGLIIGMITRTARGHTGRPLKVNRVEVSAYGLVLAAAVARVLLPIVAPQWLVQSLWLAAVAWSLAFLLYLVVYGPWLMRTRLDGKDG
ncbi:MAG: NnrS family protein [Burkholderiaceae bacterium]|nr:NnrS family protein [Burkholderiaceae bacterium]